MRVHFSLASCKNSITPFFSRCLLRSLEEISASSCLIRDSKDASLSPITLHSSWISGKETVSMDRRAIGIEGACRFFFRQYPKVFLSNTSSLSGVIDLTGVEELEMLSALRVSAGLQLAVSEFMLTVSLVVLESSELFESDMGGLGA